MSIYDWAQLLVFAVTFTLITPVLGHYMAQVFQGKKTFFHPLLQWLESFSYKIGGIDPSEEMKAEKYLKALLLFNLFGFLALFAILIFQNYLPGNPQNFAGVPWLLAFNTAISFVTNTNWQAYAGETTLSYTSQMIGLTVQNFLSAGTGAAVAVALIRGLTRKESSTIGNFWVDLVRSLVYLLIPLSILVAIILVGQGVVQTFSSYVTVETIEGASQTIPLGPVASQVAIKQLGTNGGGFFNTNSAHPFENPNGLTNFIQMLAIMLIPAGFTYTYGEMTGSKKHGWLLFTLMFVFWILAIALSIFSQHTANPILEYTPVLEGMETRFGTTNSIIWSMSTTDTASGSVNAMLSSLSPLAGGIALFNMLLGELIFGGVGVGLCNMIMYIISTVFLSGLMVGRTPEYLGKKIERKEVQWVVISILIPHLLTLVGAGLSLVLPVAISSLGNQGPHGLTEVIYAFASAAGNNGSSFAGLNANTDYFNFSLGIVMLIARGSIIVPSIALASLLAKKKHVPISLGTLSTNNLLFAILLGAIILIIGALAFFPALSLGPIIEHLLMKRNISF
jgi:K+-transporting ATPase ATPase A chain